MHWIFYLKYVIQIIVAKVGFKKAHKLESNVIVDPIPRHLVFFCCTYCTHINLK